MKSEKFNNWNCVKKDIDKKEIIKFRQGEIYFISVGQNVGYESFGKEELFLRPVLIYKKLSKETFIGIPLTSKKKEGSYYYSFSYKKEKISTAMLNQVRTFDIRRHSYYSGKIKYSDLKNIEKKLSELLSITSQKGKFGHSQSELSKYDEILTQNNAEVKSDADVPNILKQDGVMNSIFDMANQGITHIPDIIKKYGKENSWSYTLVDTESNSATLICQLPGEGNRKHHHPEWNEWWFIIDGTWQWNIEDEIKTINKGDLVFMPKGVKHKITAIGDEAAIRIAVSRYDVAHVYESEDY